MSRRFTKLYTQIYFQFSFYSFFPKIFLYIYLIIFHFVRFMTDCENLYTYSDGRQLPSDIYNYIYSNIRIRVSIYM
jgi:hypothetical protein